MPQTSDSFDLLDETGDLLRGHLFVRDFGRYRWTRIAGYPNLVELYFVADRGFSTVRDVKEHVTGQRVRAFGAIDPGWRSRFSDGAEWGGCNPQQIKDACIGGALRFDKACIAVKTLDLVFSTARAPVLQRLDVYEFLTLRPAVFVLRELDAKAVALLRGESLSAEEQGRRNELVSLLSPKDGHDEALDRTGNGHSFLDEVADGYGITYQNATMIARFLERIGLPKPDVAVLQGRTDQGRMKLEKRCNKFEHVFVGLEPAKLERLQKLMRSDPADDQTSRRR